MQKREEEGQVGAQPLLKQKEVFLFSHLPTQEGVGPNPGVSRVKWKVQGDLKKQNNCIPNPLKN